MNYSSIESALHDVNFPIDKPSLINMVGDRMIDVPGGPSMPLRDLIDACPHDNYSSIDDVTKCPDIVNKLGMAA